MIVVTECRKIDGRLGLVLGFPDEATLELNRLEDIDFIEGKLDASLFYMKNGALTERPAMVALADKSSIKADGLDVLKVAGLPKGVTTFRLVGSVCDSWDETGKQTDFTVNLPGTYRLSIIQFPYKDLEIEFDAT